MKPVSETSSEQRLGFSKSSFEGGKRGTILLIDEDAGVRDSLSYALDSENFETLSMEGGESAVGKISEGGIDVVLLDLSSSVSTGWKTFEQITAVSPFLPIIVTTARPDQYGAAATAGATAIMEKPLCVSALVKLIGTLLSEPVEQRVRRILTHRLIILSGKAPNAAR